MTGIAIPYSSSIPKELYESENAPLLAGILRGLEKECLRASADGQMSTAPHPKTLGSALTHPHITTDFSEALLEFITSPSHLVSSLMAQLKETHHFTYQNLGSEMLWSNSMPCMVGKPEEIPIAQYGTSNRGKMKSAYRVGLGHRYGRAMQTVAGVHYNFSLPRAFWAFLHKKENSVEDLNSFITGRYFALIRNFRRHYWLLIYLFGASPAMCRSFVKDRSHNLQPLGDDDHTLHLPYATSLRMGDLGYQSSAQESLQVCYNKISSYVDTLGAAIATPYKPYEDLGIQNSNGEFIQLNTHLLQIENEFYGPIRPKRTAQSGETALTALCTRGVEYIEVRCLDLDPFSPTGVTEEQIRFLDVFLVYCALQDSPDCTPEESKRILANQKIVVNQGRKPGLELELPSGGKTTLTQWAKELFEGLEPIAKLMDQTGTNEHIEAWTAQKQKVSNPEQTPSARVLSELTNKKLSFSQWANQQSLNHKAFFDQLETTEDLQKRFEDMAEESWALQRCEEEETQTSFESYLKSYYAQYKVCCAKT